MIPDRTNFCHKMSVGGREMNSYIYDIGNLTAMKVRNETNTTKTVKKQRWHLLNDG